MAALYDNQFFDDNVYGHALALLKTVSQPDNGVHLDVGCGFGRIAEPLTASLGRTYVGIDADPEGLASLSERGFETHQFMLQDTETNLAFFRKVLNGRRLASITILDTMEHLYSPRDTIAALRTLASDDAAPIVVSVPNIAHMDVAIKLLMGRFDYTEDGLLDRTHVSLFTEDRLFRLMASAGWHPVTGNNDVYLRESDQHFPSALLPLAEGSTLNQLLRSVRERADANAYVNQFVRLFMCGPEVQGEAYVQPDLGADAPFLTVVIRTDGTHPERLRELLLSLSAQSSDDFEVVVVGKKLNLRKALKKVERVIDDNVAWFRDKIRLIRVEKTNGATSANAGVANARGIYVAVLDDSHILFAQWVEAFKKLYVASPGAILRAGSVIQTSQQCENVDGSLGSFAVSGLEREASVSVDIFDLLEGDTSPASCLAFPRSIFSDLSYQFDEDLDGVEVCDLLVAAGFMCGVVNTPEVTSIDRQWAADEKGSSRGLSSTTEQRRMQVKQDASLIVLPVGSAESFRTAALEERLMPGIEARLEALNGENAHLRSDVDELRGYVKTLEKALEEARSYIGTLHDEIAARDAALAEARSSIGTLHDGMAARDAALAEAGSSIATLRDGMAARDAALAEAEANIATLRDGIAARDAALAETKQQIESLRDAKGSLTTELTSAHAVIESITNNLQDTQDALQQILGSKSWRVMSPARRLLWLTRSLGKQNR